MVWRRNDDGHQLQLDPDQHYVVDPWHFGPDPDPQIRTIDLWIRIYIRIRAPDSNPDSDTGSRGQKSTGSGSAILLFECTFTFFACLWKDPDPDVDPDPDLNKWWRIRIQEAQVKNTKILWCGSRSGCRSRSGSEQIMTYLRISGSVIFWSGSADLNHWLKDLDLF